MSLGSDGLEDTIRAIFQRQPNGCCLTLDLGCLITEPPPRDTATTWEELHPGIAARLARYLDLSPRAMASVYPSAISITPSSAAPSASKSPITFGLVVLSAAVLSRFTGLASHVQKPYQPWHYSCIRKGFLILPGLQELVVKGLRRGVWEASLGCSKYLKALLRKSHNMTCNARLLAIVLCPA
jgi:hypothetical protein